MKTPSDLASEYAELLIKVQEMLQTRRQSAWVMVLQLWIKQLEAGIAGAELVTHAKRTARALGGMESIGEIASADRDQVFLKLVEALSAKCTEITRLLPDSEP
jgi:hypothetical protein